MKNKLFLIDGNSFCYRAYYAIRNLSNSKGQPTNAVYGFITMLKRIVEAKKPDYIAVAFDLKGPTFRHEQFKEYKINRKPMPDDLISQMPIIKDVLHAYNIAIFEKEGFEADDVLATIAKKASDNGLDVYIVTSDKDALQLVSDTIKVYNPYKNDVIIDKDTVQKQFKVEPKKLADIMALSGDSIDNIPGVTGIGEKTAIELIEEFGSLEDLLLHKDKIRNKVIKKALESHEDKAKLSKELATIHDDVPITIDIKRLKVTKPDEDSLFKLFKEMEFRTLLKELNPKKDSLKVSVQLIKDKDDLETLAAKAKKKQEISLYCVLEDRQGPLPSKVIGLIIALTEKDAYYFSMSNCPQAHLGIIKSICEDANISKVVHDGKSICTALSNYAINIQNISFDTMIASYLINSSKTDHSFQILSLEHLGLKFNFDFKDFDLVNNDKAISQDFVMAASVILRLKTLLKEELKRNNLLDLFEKIEVPLIYVLADMELSGVAIDENLLHALSIDFSKTLDKLIHDIYEIAGCEFNINSPKQLAVVLFEKLKLPIVKKTKTGISTDIEVLEKLSTTHALPANILKYRELAKLKSTYIDALPKLVNPKTGRIHTSFNQTVTQTGRLSSSNPNIQNIPIRTEIGRQIRKSFIPRQKENLLVSSDYSQIELRILAHISEDKNLIEAFLHDLDIHRFTAHLIFNVKEDQVTPVMRNTAKTVNFAVLYGMSAYGLSRDLKISVQEAKDFIDAYFKRYPKVKDYVNQQIEFATTHGYVITLFNRKRFTPELKSTDITIRQFGERAAINAPIQGSASDIIKIAMINIHKRLLELKLSTKMILQVHDELVFDVPKKEQDAVYDIVKEGMEKVIRLKVPIKVDIKKGKNWLEME